MIVRCREITDRGGSAELACPKTVSLAGMGGQGVSLAADILHEAAELAGFEAALLEIYSIGRRGGSVRCQVTLAPQDSAGPACLEPERVDYLLAFEMKSGLDLLGELAPQGLAIVHRRWLDAKGHSDPSIAGRWTPADERVQWVEEIDSEVDDRTLPAYLLGALSRQLPIGAAVWREALARHVPPKLYAEAIDRFDAGALEGVAS